MSAPESPSPSNGSLQEQKLQNKDRRGSEKSSTFPFTEDHDSSSNLASSPQPAANSGEMVFTRRDPAWSSCSSPREYDIPRRTSCFSDSAVPDTLRLRERRSHSLVEVLDTRTILSARLKNIQIDLERLRVEDKELQSVFSDLSATVQCVAQELTIIVPVDKLASIGDTFKATVAVPTASQAQLRCMSSQHECAKESPRTPTKPRPAGDLQTPSPELPWSRPLIPPSPSVPTHLEVGHLQMMQAVESMSLQVDGDSLVLSYDEDFSTYSHDDVSSMGSFTTRSVRHPSEASLCGGLRTPEATSPGFQLGSLTECEVIGDRNISTPVTVVTASLAGSNQPSLSAVGSKSDPPKKRRALFTSLRESPRHGHQHQHHVAAGEDAKDKENGNSNSLLWKLLRRTPNSSKSPGGSGSASGSSPIGKGSVDYGRDESYSHFFVPSPSVSPTRQRAHTTGEDGAILPMLTHQRASLDHGAGSDDAILVRRLSLDSVHEGAEFSDSFTPESSAGSSLTSADLALPVAAVKRSASLATKEVRKLILPRKKPVVQQESATLPQHRSRSGTMPSLRVRLPR